MKKPYEIVQDLNEELYVRTNNDSMWFSYTLDNFVDSIAFNSFGENYNVKIDLWNSEDSQQQYREVTDDYEPLEDTIKRELKVVLSELNEVL